MREYVDLLLTSIVAHDPSILPLAPRYRATENSVPAALRQMTAWSLGQAVNAVGTVVVDEELGQIVVVANLQLGGAPATFWARLAVVDGLIAELEVYHAQSAADGGNVMHADEIGKEPAPWHAEIPADGRATREELLALGRGVFIDAGYVAPDAAPDCYVVEQGGIVWEETEFTELAFGDGAGRAVPGERRPMIAGLPPFRPLDATARVVAVDVEQGTVVTIGTVPGQIMPTVTTTGNTSAFVPASIRDLHARSILPEWLEGRSVVLEDRVVCVSTQILRLYDGRLQGLQMLNSLTGAGATPVWLEG